jgi:hypothetical protein
MRAALLPFLYASTMGARRELDAGEREARSPVALAGDVVPLLLAWFRVAAPDCERVKRRKMLRSNGGEPGEELGEAGGAIVIR